MKPTCFLDMDGVLVDLQSRVKRDFGYAPGEYDKSIWEWTDEAWWSSLPWTTDGRIILGLCERAFGQDNVVICSTPAWQRGNAEGKLRWIEREIPAYRRRFILTPEKERCANPHTTLVDDWDKNIALFERHGGKTILVPRPWNHGRGVHAAQYVAEKLFPPTSKPQAVYFRVPRGTYLKGTMYP